jgi:hypothetical protein
MQCRHAIQRTLCGPFSLGRLFSRLFSRFGDAFKIIHVEMILQPARSLSARPASASQLLLRAC